MMLILVKLPCNFCINLWKAHDQIVGSLPKAATLNSLSRRVFKRFRAEKYIVKFEEATDVKESMEKIVAALGMERVDIKRLFCMRSHGSKGRSIARIWSMPRIWQKALGIKAHYVIEVISERFDKLNAEDREKTLIHELLHIPKSFSGGLVPHNCFGKRIDRRAVDRLFDQYKKLSN